MFTIPIESFRVPDWDKWKPIIMSQLDEHSPQAHITGGRVNTHEMDTDYHDLVTNKSMPKYYWTVIDALKPIMDEMQLDYPLDIYNIVAMWHQTTANGQFHGVHNHGPVGITAVLYVDFDVNEHKPTKFYSPFTNPYYGTVDVAVPPVEEGNIIAFPSTMLHECPPSQSKIPRTIMSFNIPMR